MPTHARNTHSRYLLLTVPILGVDIGTEISTVRKNKVIIVTHTLLRNFSVAAVLVCLPTFAAAVPLGFGDTVPLAGTTAAAEPDLAGTVRNDNVISDFIHIGPTTIFAIGAELQNRVVESSSDGTMIFAPRLSTTFNNTGGNFLVDRLVLYNFGDFDVDVNYRTDGLGDRGPTSASRSADGNTLTFDYGFPLVGSNLFQNPQEDSYFLSLNTDATAFSLDGHISVFARHVNYPGNTYRFDFANIAVPIVAPVPLPASLLFLASALGIGGILRRRNTRPA